MLQRRDSIRLDDSSVLNGRKLSPVTRAGIFVYHNEDGTIRRELRAPEWVFHPDSMASLAQVPVTLGHPADFVTDDNFSELAVGYTGDTVRRDGTLVTTPIKLHRRDAKQAVAGGIRELSCGYEFDRLDMSPGEYEGEQYDAIQVGPFRYNHVALVSQGRAGASVRYLDGQLSAEHLQAALAAGEAQMSETTTIRIDDAQAVIPMDLAALLLKMHAKMEALEGELSEAKAYKAKAEELEAAEDDDMYDKRDDAKAKAMSDDDKAKDDDDEDAACDDDDDDDSKPAFLKAKMAKKDKGRKDAADLQARVDARVELIAALTPHLPAGYDCKGKTDAQVRADALTHIAPDVAIDGKSAEYIAARLDAAIEARRMDSYRSLVAPVGASRSRLDQAHDEYLAAVAARQKRERGDAA